jgi:hypothetical protein
MTALRLTVIVAQRDFRSALAPAAWRLPTRRSRTIRCKCHAWRTYRPFQCAAHPHGSEGRDWPDGPAFAGKVEATVLQTAAIPTLTCRYVSGI